MELLHTAGAAALHWIRTHREWVLWLGGASALVFLGTLLVVPILVIRMPSDYFAASRRKEAPARRGHPVLRAVALTAKNVVGVLLIAAGVAMLVLPGQGILTTFMGLMLLDFPGKYRLERRLVALPMIHRSIDWIRLQAGRAPLEL